MACEYFIGDRKFTEQEFKDHLTKEGLDLFVDSGDIKLENLKAIPPTKPPIEKQSTSGEGKPINDKSLLNRLLGAKDISEDVKKNLEDKGLKYEVQSREEAEAIAKTIVNDIGAEEAVIRAEASKFGGGVNTAIFAEALNKLTEQERASKTNEEKLKYATQFADVAGRFDEFLRKQGRDISQVASFYKSSPLGVAIKINKDRSAQFAEWFDKNKQDYKEVFNELIKSEEGQLLLKDEVEKLRKEERKEERKKRDKNIDDFFEKAKMKGGTYATIIPPNVWNAAIDIMAASVKAGDRVADAVKLAIEHIDKNLKGQDWDKEAFRKDYEDKLGKVADGGKKEPSYVESLDKRKKELERRIREKDFSAEEYKEKKTLTDKEKEAKAEYDKVKAEYDEAKKSSKEFIDKKAKMYLDQFRKKLKGIDEDKKEEVIRRSIKKLVESGALQYEDFKDIIGDVMGFKRLTSEETARVEELVKSINSLEDYEKAMVDNPTKANIEAFEKERDKSLKASLELYNLVHRESDVTNTARSIITGSLLGIPTLIKNPMQNVVFQAQLRFPKAVVKHFADLGIEGVSKIANYISPNSPIYKSTSDILRAQKGYFQAGKLGLVRESKNFMRGTHSDLLNNAEYRSTLSPKQASIDLKLYKAGQKYLTREEVWDRRIRKSIPARQADFILRAMGLGDAPQRYAAEGAKGIQIATKELGLISDDEVKAFILSPEKMAYKVFKSEGKTNEEATSLAKEIKERISEEGEKAVFQEKNWLSNISDWLERGLKRKQTDASATKSGKVLGSITKTLTFPFVKIPANVAWATFKTLNPEFTLAQSFWYTNEARRYRNNGDEAQAKKYIEKAKDSFAHAAVGYGIGLAASTLVANGYVRPSNDRDTKAKESAGEKVFGRQNEFNLGKLIGTDDYWVDLSWFGPLGGMLDVKAQMAQDKKQRKVDGEEESVLGDIVDKLSYSAKASFNQLVFDQGAQFIDALKDPSTSGRQWAVNSIFNTAGNILTGATYTAISKATLSEQARLKGDNFWEDVVNNQKQRNILLRTSMNVYKPEAGNPPSKVSIWGDPIKNDNTVSGVVSNLLGFEKGSADKFGATIFDDAQRTGNINFYPQVVPNKLKVDEKEVKLLQSEKDDLDKFVGKYRKQMVAPFINDHAVLKGYDKTYDKLTDDEKLAALDAIYTQAKDAGMEDFKKKYPKYEDAKLDIQKLKKEVKEDVKKTLFEVSLMKNKP